MQNYSVLMSVYYKEKPEYLKQSLESMLKQTILPEQIVLVKDGVLTGELEIVIKNYADEYPDLFTIISLKENKGLGNALNIGLKACRNELVARMDSDDISVENRCEKQLALFEKESCLDIVGTQINEFVDDPGQPISSRVVPLNHKEILKFSRRRSPFNHPTVMFKKSTILSNDGYVTSGRNEDLDLFVRILHNGAKAKNINEALLLYRSNEDNLSRRKGFKNCFENISIVYNFYKKGYSSFFDLMYVAFGQIAMFIMPRFIVERLNRKYLRSKPI